MPWNSTRLWPHTYTHTTCFVLALFRWSENARWVRPALNLWAFPAYLCQLIWADAIVSEHNNAYTRAARVRAGPHTQTRQIWIKCGIDIFHGTNTSIFGFSCVCSIWITIKTRCRSIYGPTLSHGVESFRALGPVSRCRWCSAMCCRARQSNDTWPDARYFQFQSPCLFNPEMGALCRIFSPGYLWYLSFFCRIGSVFVLAFDFNNWELPQTSIIECIQRSEGQFRWSERGNRHPRDLRWTAGRHGERMMCVGLFVCGYSCPWWAIMSICKSIVVQMWLPRLQPKYASAFQQQRPPMRKTRKKSLGMWINNGGKN